MRLQRKVDSALFGFQGVILHTTLETSEEIPFSHLFLSISSPTCTSPWFYPETIFLPRTSSLAHLILLDRIHRNGSRIFATLTLFQPGVCLRKTWRLRVLRKRKRHDERSACQAVLPDHSGCVGGRDWRPELHSYCSADGSKSATLGYLYGFTGIEAGRCHDLCIEAASRRTSLWKLI